MHVVPACETERSEGEVRDESRFFYSQLKIYTRLTAVMKVGDDDNVQREQRH